MVDVRNPVHTFFTVRTSGSGMPRRTSALSICSHTRALCSASTLVPPSNTEMCSLIRLARNSFISFGQTTLPLTLRQFLLTPRGLVLRSLVLGNVLFNFVVAFLRCGVFAAELFFADLLCIFFYLFGTHRTVNFWCRRTLNCKSQIANQLQINRRIIRRIASGCGCDAANSFVSDMETSWKCILNYFPHTMHAQFASHTLYLSVSLSLPCWVAIAYVFVSMPSRNADTPFAETDADANVNSRERKVKCRDWAENSVCLVQCTFLFDHTKTNATLIWVCNARNWRERFNR